MAVKVCVFFRPKNFSNIGALSLHICTEMTSSTKKHTKMFFPFFLMTSLQKGPIFDDVITKTLKFWWRHYKKDRFWWRHNDKLQPLISHLPWPFKNWKFGNYHLTPFTFKSRSHFTFSKIKICDTSCLQAMQNRG